MEAALFAAVIDYGLREFGADAGNLFEVGAFGTIDVEAGDDRDRIGRPHAEGIPVTAIEEQAEQEREPERQRKLRGSRSGRRLAWRRRVHDPVEFTASVIR